MVKITGQHGILTNIILTILVTQDVHIGHVACPYWSLDLCVYL